MTSNEFRGVIAAVAMPMSHAGERIDEVALLDHLDWLIDAGVHSLLVLSGTGEYAYLSAEERRRVIEICLPHIAGRVPVMAQSSEMTVTATIEASRHAVDHGADALMVLTPWLESPNERGILYHYERVAQAVDAPIALYNTPSASGVELTPAIYRQLLAIDNIRYMKDSQGDLTRLQRFISVGEGSQADVLCGVDTLAPFALMAGATGIVWGTANIMPHECVRLVELINQEKFADAFDLWHQMWPISSLLLDNDLDIPFLPGVKCAAEMVGRQMGQIRRPQMPVTGVARAAIQGALSTLPVNGLDRANLQWREWDDEQAWLTRRIERSQG